ncbi:hypothetical protein B0H13DRAFT_1861670 [Mycena leptocephala]|nr:hypothetical protein B0H13DRAFT_1861670 [Mycena leptocephala]
MELLAAEHIQYEVSARGVALGCRSGQIFSDYLTPLTNHPLSQSRQLDNTRSLGADDLSTHTLLFKYKFLWTWSWYISSSRATSRSYTFSPTTITFHASFGALPGFLGDSFYLLGHNVPVESLFTYEMGLSSLLAGGCVEQGSMPLDLSMYGRITPLYDLGALEQMDMDVAVEYLIAQADELIAKAADWMFSEP